MEIVYKNVAELIPYAGNTKSHPKEQVKRIASSIKNFGFNNPVLLDKSGCLVAGHGRLLAAQSLGIGSVPTVCIDHLTPEQIRAYRIADNKTAESGWLEDVLQQEMSSLLGAGVNLASTGFSPAEIEALLDAEIASPADPDAVPDVETSTPPRVQLGDIWVLGEHRLVCGDSAEIEDVERLTCGEKMECLITDPPYGVDYGAKTRFLAKGRKNASGHRDIANDALAEKDFAAFLGAVFANASAVLCPGGACYVFYADTYVHIFREALAAAGILVKQTLIWVKNAAVISRQDYHWRHEPCIYGWKSGASHRWVGDRKQTTVVEPDRPVTITPEEGGGAHILTFTDGARTCKIRVPEYTILSDVEDSMETVWRIDRPVKSKDHPTMKPVELISRAVRNSTCRTDPVLDLFLGSGTTLIACEMLGRRCFGIEKDPAYCDVILRRWEDYTGKTAKKE